MVMSFDQTIAAAIRHVDSAANIAKRKVGGCVTSRWRGIDTQRTKKADKELTFVSSIIVESVVDSAIKPKAWLENEMVDWEGRSPFRRLRA